MLIGIAQERFADFGAVEIDRSFNPCVDRNSSGASISPRRFRIKSLVSIRVLIGIAQEPYTSNFRLLLGVSFNPCVDRNSSGA